jgi:hypothetical protein
MVPLTGIFLMAALSLPSPQAAATTDRTYKSEVPRYDLQMPATFEHTETKPNYRKFVHSCGRDQWEQVSATLTHGSTTLPQNPSGTVTLEDLLPFATLPPDSKTQFAPMKWKNLDIGVIEYQAVVKSLPIIGLCVVLPLKEKALTLNVSAPTPLEKEARADFSEILSRITETRTGWYTVQDLGTMKTMDLVGKAGVGVLLLYPMAWLIFFRGDAMRAHWARVAWLAIAAVLLFLPITSPGPTTMLNNLVVNAVMPFVLLAFLVRRVKLGIDEG